MRNWVGGIKGLSLPEFVEEPRRSKGSLTVKVRMTVSQLKELMARVDMSNGDSDSELGSLILQYSCLDHMSKANPPRTIAASHHQAHDEESILCTASARDSTLPTIF